MRQQLFHLNCRPTTKLSKQSEELNLDLNHSNLENYLGETYACEIVLDKMVSIIVLLFRALQLDLVVE